MENARRIHLIFSWTDLSWTKRSGPSQEEREAPAKRCLPPTSELAWPSSAQNEAPNLVIMLVVDQLRADLLDRYEPAFNGGFRRLLDEGFRFTQASHAHARTSTAPGHATLATGVFPSRHAVVANSWYEKVGSEWESSYAVGDPPSSILGFETFRSIA